MYEPAGAGLDLLIMAPLPPFTPREAKAALGPLLAIVFLAVCFVLAIDFIIDERFDSENFKPQRLELVPRKYDISNSSNYCWTLLEVATALVDYDWFDLSHSLYST